MSAPHAFHINRPAPCRGVSRACFGSVA